MPIQRLAPHASDLDVTVTIPKKVRPYLTEMYKEEKEDNETADAYILRTLNERAHNFYIKREAGAALDALKVNNQAERDALRADLEALTEELV